jgi:hypothetical protein
MPNKKLICVGQLVKVKEGLEDEELGNYINKLGLVLRPYHPTMETSEHTDEDEELWEILIHGNRFIFNEDWLIPWYGSGKT